ncbi:hypothetical protein [Bradyrhizobium elkanii]|uniref:hypothetical protein n=1 Tax=Bradyrhizobium elkanii TaxID=29448 RepID=UPI0035190E73
MTVQLANNATSRLASSISSTDTTISVQPGDGAKYPTLTAGDTFPVTLLKSDGQLEICRCTARSGDVLTVLRAQEGTTGKSFAAGDRVEVRLTKGTWDQKFSEAMSHVFLTAPTNANTLIADNKFYTWMAGTVVTGGSNWPPYGGGVGAGFMDVRWISGDIIYQRVTLLANGKKPRVFDRFGNGTTWDAWKMASSLDDVDFRPTASAGDVFIDGEGFYRWNGSTYVKSDLSYSSLAALVSGVAAAMGPNQTTQDVGAGRAAGVSYVNSTARPIMVLVQATTTQTGGNLYATIGGVICQRSYIGATGSKVALQITVPPGVAYRIDAISSNIDMWIEYR